MHARISQSLVAAALAFPLLAGCASGATAPTSGGPTTAAAAPSTTVATPSPSTAPSDTRHQVEDATSNFIDEAFTVGYSTSSNEHWARVRPLVTSRLYPALRKDLDLDEGLETARARFGSDARAKTKIVGDVKVSKIGSGAATTEVRFVVQIQQPRGDGWKTVKKSPEETATLKLVKDGDDWLVDELE